MNDILRPRLRELFLFAAGGVFVLSSALGTLYIAELQDDRAQIPELQARIRALENRPTPPARTVTPSPTEPSPSSPTPDPPGSESPPSGGSPLAAASGDREPVSRSPRDPDTGGSPSTPPIAAPPSEQRESCPADSGLLSLCVKASLLSTREPAG